MTGHPFDDLFMALVQRLQIFVLPPVEATVVSQGADGRLDLEIDEALGLGKGPQGVDLSLQGVAAVKIAPGAKVLLEFLAAPSGSSEPRRPVVRTILEGTILEATITTTASAKILGPNIEIGNGGAVVKLAGGSKPVVRVGDIPTGLTAGPNPVTGTIAVGAPGTVLA